MNDGYIEVLSSISSSSPTPGGGSVAALSLAHAHSLAAMVSRLTLKSDKWSEGHEIANQIVDESHARIKESVSLAEKDADAFDAVMASYRIPKGDGDSTERSDAIRKATIEAALAPLETVRASHELLKQLLVLSRVCNSNALTDLAASCELAQTAANIAQMNIRINTDYINGDDVDSIDSECENAISQCGEMMNELRSIYTERLGW